MSAIEVSDKEIINFKYNFRVYFGFLKAYKWACFWLVLVLLFLSLLDLAFNYCYKLIVDHSTHYLDHSLTAEALRSALLWVFAGLLAIPVGKSWGRWYFLGGLNRLESSLIADIKRHFFNHLLTLSHGFHSSHKTGSLISRLARASGAVETMTDGIFFQYVPIFFQMTLFNASILYFDRSIGLVVIGTVAVYIAFSLIVTRRNQSANALYNNMSDIEKANISDVFTNIESIKYFAKEGDVQARFHALSEKTRELQLGFWDLFKWLEGGQILIVGAGTFALIYLSVESMVAGTLAIGTFVFIFATFINILQPLFQFIMAIRNMYRALSDFEDLFQYGKLKNDIQDKPGAKGLKLTRGAVEFKDVTFTYRKRPILNGFTLKVPAHQRVAVVGPSGAGKTTLIRLLYRLYDLERGSIRIDGEDIAGVTQASLRESLSMVPQECILFDDSLYNNIAFSNPKAGRKEVFAAMRFAQLDKFIESLPNKEKTIVGERGVKLSGGEKQRVSIARALLADKKMLILDEATSSLDSETEFAIQKALKGLMKGRTCILIAHRLSTIMSADIIVVLDKGKVAQLGNHRELIQKPGLYRKLWNLQKGGYID
ncbi:MAG TPA: ABC transporter ATP-binding protein [bacterium]|nr:ABC transporter ATP-binding protein [bacterium]